MSFSPAIKPTPYRPPSREEIERARAMYAQGFTVSRILAACDMALGTLYYWLDGGPNEAEGPLLPALPRRRVVMAKRRRPLASSRVSLTARLWRTAERQVRDIEERLSRGDRPAPERERDTRMLAIVVRTLRDLSAFDGFDGADGQPAAAPEPEHDIEDMRRDLARRLDRLVAESQLIEDAGAGDLTPDGAQDMPQDMPQDPPQQARAP
jgi:uncharacterized membrane protein YccC